MQRIETLEAQVRSLQCAAPKGIDRGTLTTRLDPPLSPIESAALKWFSFQEANDTRCPEFDRAAAELVMACRASPVRIVTEADLRDGERPTSQGLDDDDEDAARVANPESAPTERERPIAGLCDDAERILDERAPHFARHVREILARIRRSAGVT